MKCKFLTYRQKNIKGRGYNMGMTIFYDNRYSDDFIPDKKIFGKKYQPHIRYKFIVQLNLKSKSIRFYM